MKFAHFSIPGMSSRSYTTLSQTIESIGAGVPLYTMRQDYVYELFRRGLLEMNASDTLLLSESGRATLEKLRAGERATELE